MLYPQIKMYIFDIYKKKNMNGNVSISFIYFGLDATQLLT